MEIDVFDFDKTLYNGDCTIDFYFFCLKRRPLMALLWPVFAVSLFLFFIRVISMESLKSSLFLYLRFFGEDTLDALIKTFWDINRKKLNPFFKPEFMERFTLVISASPTILVYEGCKRRGADCVIGTDINPRTGQVIGKNCRGSEKVRRLKAMYPDATVVRMFSDSLADRPLLEIASKPYLVRHGVISKWRS